MPLHKLSLIKCIFQMLLTCSILQLMLATTNDCHPLCVCVCPRMHMHAHKFGLLQNEHIIFNFCGHKVGIGNVLYLIYSTENYYYKISSQCLAMFYQQKLTAYEEILKE